MRERINRLAKGIVDTENPEIIITPSEIEEIIRAGETVKRELFITSGNSLNIKGLAYSTNRRVKVGNHAFGGIRNHVNYEVDAGCLEHGDAIKGSFYLVTNDGEKEIPYSFRIELSASGQTLGEFKTTEDFARLAKEDIVTALKLFEYHDFMEAPFMQDLHIRTLYDGLKARFSRENALEEFLLELGAKKPVEVRLPSGSREYRNHKKEIKDMLQIQKEGWGYVKIQIRADGDFIAIPDQAVTDADFRDGTYETVYRILPNLLHKGKNYGTITLTASGQTEVISIMAEGSESADVSNGDTLRRQERYKNYLMLRVDYESGMQEGSLLLGRMLRELEKLRNENGFGNTLSLLMAENFYLTDRTDKACLILDEIRDSVLADRMEQVEDYCCFQYLNLMIQKKEGQRESLIRLIRKYLNERKGSYLLFFLLLKMDLEIYDNPGTLLSQMKKIYIGGCSSPFLYIEACKLLNREPGLLRNMEAFELHALYMGAKKEMLSENLALACAGLANGVKYFHKLYCRLLFVLYGQYPRKEILGAICCMLIKGDCRTHQAFTWFEAGLLAGISLTRLYEYYLYSLPEDYSTLLPKEVLLYFSYTKELDRKSKSVLYMNILTYLKPESPIYKEYERDMEQFAMEQLFQSRIDSRLATIYDNMIYKDMIDVPVARVLPAILRSYKIRCTVPSMRYVIVCHEELTDEDAFPLKEGVAYVPLFSEHHILLFQDANGDRYTNISHEKVMVMNRPDLELRCFEVFPDHPMLRLKACREIVDAGAESEEQVVLLQRALEDLEVHPLYQREMLAQIIAYYQKRTESDDIMTASPDTSYLLYLDKRGLSKSERASICGTIISQGYMKEAYDMIRRYGCDEIDPAKLLKLCSKMILQKLFDQDELLLKLSFQVFEAGQSDTVIMDYLCEHYNGTADQMYRVLKQGIEDHVETYDLEERLLAQMLFSGKLDHVEEVFELYVTRKKNSESLVKAYFTVKSMKYFFDENTEDTSVFPYLEGAIQHVMEKDKVPTIYLLALTKYYGTLSKLDEEQKQVCQSVTSFLLEEGLVFPYFKKLSKYAMIPDDIMDKAMIQYIGRRDSRIDLQIRVLPEEEDFHGEDLKRVYQGVFVKQKVLFEGENMEYRIYEYQKVEKVLMANGSITCEKSETDNPESRFACLNAMGMSLISRNEESLKIKMKEYLIKNAAVEELFAIM